MSESTLPDLQTDEAWRSLDAMLRPFVARRVRTDDVDDVVQDVFVRIARSVSALRDEERFGPWVYRVARSAIVDYQRGRARHPSASSPAAEVPAEEPGDDRDVEREVAAYAALFVALLPSPYREALTLTELGGRTQVEAAEMVGISVSGMKSRVQRGRRMLRASLVQCCDIALDARRRVIGVERRGDGALRGDCCREDS